MSSETSEKTSKKDEVFTSTKGKMKVQQRMIDLTARELQSTRLSSRTITSESSSPSCALKENIVLLENKLMKLFSRQLMHKHICLHEVDNQQLNGSDITADSLNAELDELISFEMFLTVAGLEEITVKAFLSDKEIGLSVDKLFLMTPQELQEVFIRLDIVTCDCHKLVSLLDLMTHYYEKWVKGENPTAGLYDIRRNSSTGRLNSLTSLDSIRKDSTSAISPPAGGGNQGSRSSTPLTPLTPSNHSPFLGLPHQNSITSHMNETNSNGGHFVRSNSSAGSVHNVTLSDTSGGQQLSSSLSSLSSDQSTSHQNNNISEGLIFAPPPIAPPPPPILSQSQLYNNYTNNSYNEVPHPSFTTPALRESHTTTNIKAKRKLGHTRSHSNPPLANLILPEMVPENSVPDYRSPSPPNYYNGSHPPPMRTGSHPSVLHNSTTVNSPNSFSSTKSHPQLRRLRARDPTPFSRSISSDLGDVPPEPPIRSNSEASGVQNSSPRQRRLSKETGTSASMVDLPLIQCSGDHYDFVSSHHSNKSHSVPRLASLVVHNGNNNGHTNSHNGDNNNNHSSGSVPTSPRLPSNYNPTGVIGHKIDHRFVSNLFFGVQECDYCKKTLVMNGYKCRYCKYKCHKHCSKLAPSNCGLPKYFLNYARQHLMMSPSYENVHQVNQGSTTPTSARGYLTNSGEYASPSTPTPNDLRNNDDAFLIQDLNREPSNSQYSPVTSAKRYHPPPSPAYYQQEFKRGLSTSSTSRLEVPQLLHPSPLHNRTHNPHSTSSSPSTSSQSSPCLTPVSPRSPMEHIHMEYPGYLHRSIPIVLTDTSDTNTDDEDYQDSDGFTSDSSTSSFGDVHYSNSGQRGVVSNNDINNKRLRLPAQGIAAQSLPNLLLAQKRQGVTSRGERGGERSGGSEHNMYATSEDNLQSWFVPRKVSLAGTISTADSKTSTLVGSIMEDIDDDEDSYCDSEGFGSQGAVDEDTGKTRIRHRNSVVDEWIIPYDDLKLVEKLGGVRGVAEVFKGYWHGDVAVKRFVLPNATPEQLRKFREEVAILKKTRHENLALFMGACLTTPNLAIVTSYCRGYTLYKLVHYWSEVFSLERLVSVGRQIAQAMGYLHARGIIHKGLNSKNIFLEKTKDHKEKVVITDMGLSSLSSLLSNDSSNNLTYFPRTQLYCLAPEIIRVIRPAFHFQLDQELYTYNHATDIYAFGTILYELITRRYPFSCDSFAFPYEPEVVIFLVGRGERQPFKTTDVPKQLKDIVWQCWSMEPTVRPPFAELQERLARLCRKHTPITRSPSHPINLSKSVDNLLHI